MSDYKEGLYDEAIDLVKDLERCKDGKDKSAIKLYNSLIDDLNRSIDNNDINDGTLSEFYYTTYNLTNLLLGKFCLHTRLNKYFRLIKDGNTIIGLSVFSNLFDEEALVMFPNMSTEDIERMIRLVDDVPSPFVKESINKFYSVEEAMIL